MERIVEAAARLFAERGYAGSTISELSKAAGVSRALLSFHFGSKEGILDTVVNRARKDVQEVFEQVDDLKGLDGLRAFLELRTEFFQERPHVARLMMVLNAETGANSSSSAAFREYQDRRIKLFTRCMAEAVEDGSLRPDVDVEETALLLAAAADGDLRMWSVDPERRPLEQTHHAILDLLRLLGAPAA